MITTEVINDISPKIGGYLGDNCSHFGLCYQMQDGKVVEYVPTQSEKKFVGIDDTKGEYFYIRRLSDFTQEKLSKKISGSCGSVQRVDEKLRLVGVWKCADPESLIKVLKVCLLKSAKTFKNSFMRGGISILFDKTSANFQTIYKLETKKEQVTWNCDLRLCLIDFTLSYDYDFCNVSADDLKIC